MYPKLEKGLAAGWLKSDYSVFHKGCKKWKDLMYLCLTENPAHTLELNFVLHKLGILILCSVCLKKSLMHISITELNTRNASLILLVRRGTSPYAYDPILGTFSKSE
jgi:hypothetical protein